MTTEQKPEIVRTPEVMIHDWDHEGSELLRKSPFKLLDTTLRDGVQMPKIRQPSLIQKLQIIDYDAKVGFDAVDICMPGVRGRYYKEGVECAKYIHQNYLNMEIVVLTRTINSDVEATIDFARDSEAPISVILFRGSSDLRLLAEDWNEGQIIEDMYAFSKRLVSQGLKVICATEDTTRTRTEFLKSIFGAGIEGGATELCVADTVGYADPSGVEKQIKWVRNNIRKARDMYIHYHGHNDTGNSVANTIAAIKAGNKIIGHGTWLGAGERCGNTPHEALLSDLNRRGIDRYDISHVVQAANATSQAFNIPIPKNHPLVGEIVFTTMSGIHAAGNYKAEQRHIPDNHGGVYSAVSPHSVGRENSYIIGTLSGKYSVMAVIEDLNKRHGLNLTYSDEFANALIKQANINNASYLEDEEVIRIHNTLSENGNGQLVME